MGGRQLSPPCTQLGVGQSAFVSLSPLACTQRLEATRALGWRRTLANRNTIFGSSSGDLHLLLGVPFAQWERRVRTALARAVSDAGDSPPPAGFVAVLPPCWHLARTSLCRARRSALSVCSPSRWGTGRRVSRLFTDTRGRGLARRAVRRGRTTSWPLPPPQLTAQSAGCVPALDCVRDKE